jgi:uncharacterized phage infection (PIP) family protein YhgE
MQSGFRKQAEKNRANNVNETIKRRLIMKRWTILLITGLVVLCLGCGSQEQPKKTAAPKETKQEKKAVTPQEVKQKVGEAAKTGQEYLAQQQAEYYKQAQEKLNDMNQKISDLRQQAEKQTGDLKKKLEEQTAALQKQVEETKSKLSAMKEASGDAWQKLKAGMDDAMKELQQSYKQAESESK